MINNKVPADTVRQMLDQASPEMTTRYATIKHQTLRREFDLYQDQIKISGEIVHLDLDGPLSDAAWAKEDLARAKQALPNGYCGLPLQQQCPHPNACLTCPSFLTTGEFLPLHREQLERTEQLITQAESDGRRRVVDMNTPIRENCSGSSTVCRRSRTRATITAEHPAWLAAAAARKHHSTVTRASAAVLALDRAGATVNFQAVTRAAGVSRQWLYQQPNLRLQIEQLRGHARNSTPGLPTAQRSSEASLRQRIRSLLDENHRLRSESTALRAELALAYAQRRATRHNS